jgi:hypothetical protein
LKYFLWIFCLQKDIRMAVFYLLNFYSEFQGFRL